jgi:hypothetical protein
MLGKVDHQEITAWHFLQVSGLSIVSKRINSEGNLPGFKHRFPLEGPDGHLTVLQLVSSSNQEIK